MLRLLFRPVLIFLVVLALSNLAMSALGGQRSPRLSLSGFDVSCQGQTGPCWLGIKPGDTTIDDARQRLLVAGYKAGITNDTLRYLYFYSDELEPGCVKVGYFPDSLRLSYLRLYCMEGIRIGDAAARLGVPRSVVYRYSPFGDAEFLTYTPRAGLSGVTLAVGSGWGSLYRPLASIDIFALDAFRRAETVSGSWRGFVPMWRYCQLEPAYPRC